MFARPPPGRVTLPSSTDPSFGPPSSIVPLAPPIESTKTVPSPPDSSKAHRWINSGSFGFGRLLGSRGFDPFSTSMPSLTLSPSVSITRGLVPNTISSPSFNESPSVSARIGEVLFLTSSPSNISSLSVSCSSGSLPKAISSALLRPSISWSS